MHVTMTLVIFPEYYSAAFSPSSFLRFTSRRPCSGWQVMSLISFFSSMTTHHFCITLFSYDNHTTTDVISPHYARAMLDFLTEMTVTIS